MKKIVSAALLTAVAGSLFAADISVKLNARTHYTAFEHKYAKGSDQGEAETISKFTASKDTMDIELKNDYAGAHLGIAYNNFATDKDSLSTTTAALTEDNGTAKTKDKAVTKVSLTDGGQSVGLDTKFYGWMKFGNFTLTAGKFESLFTKKGNTTVVEEGLTDKDPAKAYGLSSLLMVGGSAVGKTFLYDVNTISANAGTRVVSMIADYTFADVAGGKLLLKAGAVDALTSGKYRVDAAYDGNGGTRTVGTGFVFDAALQREDFSVEGMLRTTTYSDIAAGIYASIDMVDKTPMKFGFTYGSVSKDNTDTDLATGNAFNAWAIDWRITNKSVDKLTLVLNGKYESAKAKYDDDAKDETGLYIVGQVGYEMSDLINLALSAGVYYCDLDDNDKKDQGENYIQVQPAVEFKAGKGAKFTAALLYKQALNTGDCADTFNDKTISIPCIFRVKM